MNKNGGLKCADRVKDVDRHLFFDKVKSFGIDSCLYEIPKNDLVDDMKLWPPVTFAEVYCYLIETPGDFTGEKLKAYNFPGGSSHYRC